MIAAIDADQAGLPTPCAGWDVRTLVSHLTGQDLRNFSSRAGRGRRLADARDELGDDWAAVFRERAESLRAAWRAADLDRR